MKKIKIYIHHYFTNISSFLKFFHNTKEREFFINELDNTGVVKCKYKNINFEFVFDPILNNNNDGYHVLDYFTTYFQFESDEKFLDIDFNNQVEDVAIFDKFNNLLKKRKNFIITVWRTEKLFNTSTDTNIKKLENILLNLNEHKILTDNYFLTDNINKNYKHIFYTFTNSIFEWKNIISIDYSLKFKDIFSHLNFDYDLGYSVRAHRKYRVELLNKLSDFNHPRIFLSRTNSIPSESLNNPFYNKVNKHKNINENLIEGKFDFESMYDINKCHGPGNDLYFNILNKSKMFLLDESWSWNTGNFLSQYLSEKTINLVLANIPFISTHVYPLDFLQKLFKVENHPFYNEIKIAQGNADRLFNFIRLFMQNYEKNYILCKEWTNIIHNLFMEKLENENSLLDLVLSDFKQQNTLATSKLF